MADERDIVERLKEACDGHPHAKIAWPHYLLHDAIAEIERLRQIETMAEAVNAWLIRTGREGTAHQSGLAHVLSSPAPQE